MMYSSSSSAGIKETPGPKGIKKNEDGFSLTVIIHWKVAQNV